MKSRGPSTEPWGTPCDRGAVKEVQLLILMNCCLSEIYDLSQVSAVPVMLRKDSGWEGRSKGWRMWQGCHRWCQFLSEEKRERFCICQQ